METCFAPENQAEMA
jgi:ankyrin repeat protein